jgi:glycosyltransferase involved in cell wall biosynthesis
MKITAIIPTYNRAQLLVQALESLLEGDKAPDEIVVADDGSTDETEAVVKRYDAPVRYVHQANAGKPAMLNRVLADLVTDYVWIFDDDDVALSDALERHLQCLAEHADIDFTYSGCYLFSGNVGPDNLSRGNLYDALDATPETFFARALEIFPCHTGGMLVPLECYREVGPFDESLTFGEDYEMTLRLARRFRGGKLEAPTFLMRQHVGDRGPKAERVSASDREQAWRVYEQKTFRQLRDQLELSEYLPDVGDAAGRRRRALLKRACVMARHGLLEEALEDIEAAVNEPAGAPFSASERKIAARMFDLEPALLSGQGAWLGGVQALLAERATPLLDAAAVGLVWSARREWSRHSFSGTLVMLRSLWRLTGLRIMPMAARRAGIKPIKIGFAHR